MRIITWNLNHRAARRKMPTWIMKAIESQNPDIIVLTEYVEGDDHTKLLTALAAHGLRSWCVSPRTPGENQILIASRQPLRRGDLIAPPIHKSVPSNFLHVVVGSSDLDVLGFRMPAFEGKERPIKREVWGWLLSAAETLRSHPAVIIGDFNTAPDDDATDCGDCMNQLSRDNWQHALPSSGFSWKGGQKPIERKIDHIFLSPVLPLARAEYDWGFHSLAPDAASRKVGIPDHAIVLATFDRQGLLAKTVECD